MYEKFKNVEHPSIKEYDNARLNSFVEETKLVLNIQTKLAEYMESSINCICSNCLIHNVFGVIISCGDVMLDYCTFMESNPIELKDWVRIQGKIDRIFKYIDQSNAKWKDDIVENGILTDLFELKIQHNTFKIKYL